MDVGIVAIISGVGIVTGALLWWCWDVLFPEGHAQGYQKWSRGDE